MQEASVSNFPIYNPTPTLRIDEREYPRVRDLILGMNVRECEGGLSCLELTMGNIASNAEGHSDFAFENEDDIQLGSSIALYSGDVTQPQEIFRGIITGLESTFPKEGPPEMIIYAEDKLQALRMARRTHLYQNMSLREIASDIARRHGLNDRVTGMTEAIGDWMQLNESDLAFLRRVVNRYDGDLQIVENDLQISPRQDVQRGSLNLMLHSKLQSVCFCADLAEQVTSVSVNGWNAQTGKRVKASSEGRNLGPGKGRSGASLLRDTIGERNEHIGHIAVASNAEAQALSDAAFDQCARKFVTARGVAEGNPKLRVGTHLRLSGVSPRFENTYYVCEAQHLYDVDRGYETHFVAESATLGNA